MVATALAAPPAAGPVFPGTTWEARPPEELGLSRSKLDELRDHVGGRGVVARHGHLAYAWGDAAKSSHIASAMKPVLSTILLLAVQEGKLRSPDDRVSEVEPRLTGKDAGITWRHLASQTSGYGLEEAPGAAYSYNDFALALYYDTLTAKVFREDGTAVLKTRLAGPLGFEDPFTFEAFGPKDRPGRLAVSVRDLARFGLLYLRGGRWRGRQVLRRELVETALSSPVPAELPRTSGKEGAMLPGQRSIGGSRNITPVGPGVYSFNWWINPGRRLFAAAPEDAFVASGHGGMRALWVIPSLDLIVAWNDSSIDDHDATPGNPASRLNRAARLMVEAARGTELGVQGTSFTLNGAPAFLLGCSLYGALGAPEAALRHELAKLRGLGFNWVRVWATWGAFGEDVSAVDGEGNPREPYLERLRRLVAACDGLGMVVDVTLSRGNGVTGPPRLQSLEAHRRGVETLVEALRGRRNWYPDLSNERNIRDRRFTSFEDLAELREAARRLDPRLLVTASHAGDIPRDELRDYLHRVKVDFLSPHRPREAGSPGETASRTKEYLAAMRELGRIAPVHYQEPFRRGFGSWQPRAEDFLEDLRRALQGGAAGWCLHNGDERGRPDGIPRRSFDLREKGLLDQLDEEERRFLEEIARGVEAGPRK
ncbi:MAG: serine hydrolase [Planctomycetes bacterium]|nr:serine hydrolase [Planctomycetota bacterium]